MNTEKISNCRKAKVIDTTCQSIDCRKQLTVYEIDRQKNLPRTLKYRFCRRCRQQRPTSGKLKWRCRLCPTIMYASETERGRYYCSHCGPIEGQRRSKKSYYRKIGVVK